MENGTVLIIEDDELNGKFFQDFLEIGDYNILLVEDTETGLDIARRHKPDLILIDVQLPGMDGWSATRLIKKDPDLKGIPVVALTAYAMPGDEELSMEAGCNGYISKPVELDSFLEKIALFIKNST